MNELRNSIQAVFTVAARCLSCFMGGYDGLLIVLIAFMAIDCITSFMCAVADKRLSIKEGLRYLYQKISIFMLIGIAHILDSKIIGTNSILRTKAISFYLTSEGTTLIKNIEHLGLPIPEKLKAVLKQFLNKAENET